MGSQVQPDVQSHLLDHSLRCRPIQRRHANPLGKRPRKGGVDAQLWDAVQALMRSNVNGHRTRVGTAQPRLLTWPVFASQRIAVLQRLVDRVVVRRDSKRPNASPMSALEWCWPPA